MERLATTIPPSFLEALQRSGYRFQQARRFVPVPLEDGRQLVLPVDLVEIDYDDTPVFH
jgi:hypothetical protein